MLGQYILSVKFKNKNLNFGLWYFLFCFNYRKNPTICFLLPIGVEIKDKIYRYQKAMTLFFDKTSYYSQSMI